MDGFGQPVCIKAEGVQTSLIVLEGRTLTYYEKITEGETPTGKMVSKASIRLEKLPLMSEEHIQLLIKMAEQPNVKFSEGDVEGLSVRLSQACRDARMPCPIQKMTDKSYIFNPYSDLRPQVLKPWPTPGSVAVLLGP